jgi:predicted phage terminase large subunit-like protein
MVATASHILASSEVARAANLVAARDDLQAFMGCVTPDYLDGWLVRDLCATLQCFSADVGAGLSPRLLISLPPRHGKTMHCAERFPAWHLGKHPKHRVIVASYNLGLARDAARQAREVVTSPEYGVIFPKAKLAKDTRAKADWRLTRAAGGGGMKAVGVGGGLTGFGANVLVIDDPHKNAKDALSRQRRDDVWAWYQAVARTRVQPGGGILGIWTRWHEDDLAGRILEQAKHEGWRTINYPALANEDELAADGSLRRRKGQALQPRRYPRAELLDLKRTVGEHWWKALYEGRPVAPTGQTWPRHTFARWTRGEPTPEQASLGWRQIPATFERYILSSDLTFGSKAEDASWFVLLVHGLHEGRLYLLREIRYRDPYPQQRETVRATTEAHPGCRSLVEDAAHGKAVLQDLKAAIRGLEAVSPMGGDKLARAQAAAPKIAEGCYLVPADAPWAEEFLNEVCEFPNHANDDRVDAAGQAIRHVLQRPQPNPVPNIYRGRA